MKFNPVNRHVWVEVKSARDCNLMLLEGDLIVVDASMISELKSRKNTFSVILENYIYGVLIDMA